MKFYSLLVILFTYTLNLSGQIFPNSKEALDSVYAQNIKMSKIYGVYIPKDVDDAHKRLTQLTPSEALEKFKNGKNEVDVSRKLHLGIGRWMILNWNFEEGSRLSHHLKELGLLHPDDMAQFLIRTFYRKLNDLPDNSGRIIEEFAIERKKKARLSKN